MQKNYFFAFVFSCFCVFMFLACAYHELETPYGIPIEGIAGNPAPKIFQEEVENEIAKDVRFYLGEGSLPIMDIWESIGYKSFDYANFFYKFCPASSRTASSTKLACNFSASGATRRFDIAIGQNKITVNIEDISLKNSQKEVSIKALWEISGGKDDFAIVKYEKVTNNNFAYYKKIKTSYKSAPGMQKIVAAGDMSVAVYGAYAFNTDNLRYTFCDKVPAGEIYLESLNDAELAFYDFNPACKECAPAIIDDFYGKYSYCGPWALQDLFDYLKPFVE